MEEKKVLIFGISGFVGSYLYEELKNEGYRVFGSDISKAGFDCDFIAGDILDGLSVKEIIENVRPQKIVNLSAISSVGASWKIPQRVMEVNVIGTLNILEAVRNLGEEGKIKILLIGSSEEYINTSDPISENTALNAQNPYGVSKIAQENLARLYRDHYGMDIVTVRAFNHTGIGQKDTFVLPSFCRQAAEIEMSGHDGVILTGNLDINRDFSHVKDIVRAYRMILEDNSWNFSDSSVAEKNIFSYNVGSGRSYSLRELLTFIVSLTGRKIEIRQDPERLRPVDQRIVLCDHSLISKNLGWEPRFTVFDALREMYEGYLKSL